MKIEGPGKSGSVKGTGRAGGKKPADGASFTDMLGETSEAASSAPASGVTQIASIDVLLSLQGVEDGGGGKAARQGMDLLDRLEQIRMGLLAGAIPVATLDTLAKNIAQRRDKIMDPKLADIMDEVYLRVQVELAKLGR